MVPWGMYKAVSYVKEHYGNPTMILSENGKRKKKTKQKAMMVLQTNMNESEMLTLL